MGLSNVRVVLDGIEKQFSGIIMPLTLIAGGDGCPVVVSGSLLVSPEQYLRAVVEDRGDGRGRAAKDSRP